MSADSGSATDAPPPPPPPPPPDPPRDNRSENPGPDEPRGLEPTPEFAAFLADKRAEFDARPDPPAWQADYPSDTTNSPSDTRPTEPSTPSDHAQPEQPEAERVRSEAPPSSLPSDSAGGTPDAATDGEGASGVEEASRETADPAGRAGAGDDKARLGEDGLDPAHGPASDERSPSAQRPSELDPPVAPDTTDEPDERVEPPPMQRVDDAFPGLYDRSDGNPPKDVEPFGSPAEWATDRNPGWPAPGRINNCGDCSRASELTWRGVDTRAAALTDHDLLGEDPEVMDTWTEGDRIPATFDDIKDRLETLGPGSSAIVGVDWTTGGGHWFNAVNDRGVVIASDGQNGKTERWPPTTEGVGYKESECKVVDAIFIDPRGNHLTTDDL